MFLMVVFLVVVFLVVLCRPPRMASGTDDGTARARKWAEIAVEDGGEDSAID